MERQCIIYMRFLKSINNLKNIQFIKLIITTFIVDVIIGSVSFIGIIVAYSYFIELDKGISQRNLGIIVSVFVVAIIIIPNAILCKRAFLINGRKLKYIVFELLCLLFGSVSFILIKLVVF